MCTTRNERACALLLGISLLAACVPVARAAVSERGSYSQTVDIEVPPFHTITPVVRLVYDSNSRNGLLGIGWSLHATSSIVRTLKPLGVPHYNSTDDLFWLDGMELTPCPASGQNPAARSISCQTSLLLGPSQLAFTTREESYQRVQQDTQANTWTVWKKDGTRYLYSAQVGTTSRADATLRWLLAAVIDAHRNAVAYSYTCDEGSTACYLSDITYGAGVECKDGQPIDIQSFLPTVKGADIHFYWGPRPDVLTSAIGGSLETISQRLRSIDVTEASGRARIYQIAYASEFSGPLVSFRKWQSSIASIQVFGSDAVVDPQGVVSSGTALPAHTFYSPAQQFPPALATAVSFPDPTQFLPPTQANSTLSPIYASVPVPPLPASQVPIPTYNPASPYAKEVVATQSDVLGDFDGDRKIDYLLWSVDPQCEHVTTTVVRAAVQTPRTMPPVSIPQANSCITSGLGADLDGDGRTDLIFLRYRRVDPFDAGNLNYQAEVITALSNGDGSFTYYNQPQILWKTSNQRSAEDNEASMLQSRCRTGDVNGDGRQDLVCTVKNDSGNWIVVQAISAENGQVDVKTDAQLTGLTDSHILAVADANGDGLADLMIVDAHGPGSSPTLDLKIATSKGDGTFSWSTQPTAFSFVQSGSETAHLNVGEFNGDGRADLALAVTGANNNSGWYLIFSSQAGASPLYRVTRSSVSGDIPFMSIGDADGDGLDDLLFSVRQAANSCNSTVPYDHVSLSVSLSDGSGRFTISANFNTCFPATTWPWLTDARYVAHAAYVNGDQIADFMAVQPLVIGSPPDSPGVVVLADLPGFYIGHDLQHWRSADVTGDGLADWVYVAYANPGLTVVSELSRPDGTHTVVTESLSLPAQFAHPDLASVWFLGDIGGVGSGSGPDGKADIVIPDDTAQQLLALVSKGDGHWQMTTTPYANIPGLNVSALYTILRGTEAVGTADVNGWRQLDVDGDGRADLVQIAYQDPDQPAALVNSLQSSNAALVVTTIFANGGGTWAFGASVPYFTGQLRTADTHDFTPVDLNGDGRMDLLQVERDSLLPGANANVLSLLSHGDGSWETHSTPVSLPTAATRSWVPMEVNGDASTDLAYLWTPPGGQPSVSSLISLGDGNWQPVATSVIAPTPITDTVARADVRVADLDGDGRQDFVLVNAVGVGQLATTVIWNRSPQFEPTTSTGLSLAGTNTGDWQLADIDGDDNRELVRIAGARGSMDVLTIPEREARVTQTANGMGASEDVTYGTVVEADREMPLGLLPHVVRSVGAKSLDGQSVYDELVHYAYQHARYSRPRHGFLGFLSATSSDASGSIQARFDVSDDCLTRVTGNALLDSAGRMIESTNYTFAPGAALSGGNSYTVCQLAQVDYQEGETNGVHRLRHDVYSFDAFGNLTELRQQLDNVGTPIDYRKVTAQFLANTDDFIADRAAWSEVYQSTGSMAANQWQLLSRTHYEYDGSGNYQLAPGHLGELTRISRWNDQSSRFIDTTLSYDRRGNLFTVTGPPTPSNTSGVTLTIHCDCEYERFPETLCDPLQCLALGWDRRLGEVHVSTDANGQQTVIDHDPLGRRTGITRADQSFEHWIWPTPAQWNTSAQAVRHEVSDGSAGAGVLWDTTAFDGLGRTRKVEHEGGSLSEVLQYDGTSDRIRSASAPHFPQDPPAVTRYQYDTAGRLSAVTNPDLSTRSIRYEVGSEAATDELGARITYDIDPFGRVTAVHEALRRCAASDCQAVETASTEYHYDGLDRLTGIVDAKRHRTVIVWDSLGRKLSFADPDHGVMRLKWNDDNTLASQTDANSVAIGMRYDSIGRPMVQESLDRFRHKTREIRWTWDTDPSRGGLQGASIGHVVRVDDGSTSVLKTLFSYDVLGRAQDKTECIDGSCFDLSVRFDPAGRVHEIRYPDNSGHLSASSLTVAYHYGSDGLLESVPGYLTQVVHDASGHQTSLSFANGITESRPYSPLRGWNDEVRVSRAGASFPAPPPLFDQTLKHDSVGRVSHQAVRNAQGGGYDDAFGHDDLGRLVEVQSSDPQRDANLRYNMLGNLIQEGHLGTVSYHDPKHVHAITDTGSGLHFTYDAVGQMLSAGQLRLTWTPGGQLSQAVNGANGTTSKFVYDSTRERVRSEINGQVTISPDPLIDFDSHGNVIPWIMVEGRRIASGVGAGRVFLHSDSLGSTRLLTSPSGGVLGEYNYTVWGREHGSTGSPPSVYGFAGGRPNESSGLTRFGERYYDAVVGRFISPDPTIPDLFNPQSLNRYAYVRNDPVSRVDPVGLQECHPDEDCDAPADGTPAGQQTDTVTGGEPTKADFPPQEVTVLLTPIPARPQFGPIPTYLLDDAHLVPSAEVVWARAWLFDKAPAPRDPLAWYHGLFVADEPSREPNTNRGFQIETQLGAGILQDLIGDHWVSSDVGLGVGWARQLQPGPSFSLGLGLLFGGSGTDVPLHSAPSAYSSIYSYHVEPTLSSYLQTWTWYDPDPSVGVHLRYNDPAKGLQLGATFGFSPSNVGVLGDFPNYSVFNANTPHAAGPAGGLFDLILSHFNYNTEIDAGWCLCGRLYLNF